MRKDEMMITAIGSTGLRPALDALKTGAASKGVAIRTPVSDEAAPAAPTPAAALVAAGAPIDLDKVSAIKAALANGGYRIDPDAIAGAMIAADLPAA